MDVITVIKDENGLQEEVKIENHHEDILTGDKEREPYPVEGGHILQQAQQQIEEQYEEQHPDRFIRTEAGFAYIIQREHINEDGETTVAYRLSDSPSDANTAVSDGYQLVAVDQYPTQSYQDGEGNVFQILYVNQDVEGVTQNDPECILELDQGNDQTSQQNEEEEEEDQQMYESYEEQETDDILTVQENLETSEPMESLDSSVEIKYESDFDVETENTLNNEETNPIISQTMVQQQHEEEEHQIEDILAKIEDKNKKKNLGKTYDCTQCKKECKSLGIGDFKCNDCEKLFVYQISLQRHASIEHPKYGLFKCADCQKTCSTKESLIEHVQFHAFKPIKCEDCGRKFGKKFHLERHMSLKGCGGGIIPKFTCKACRRTFSRKENLVEHLKSHLSEVQPIRKIFTCDHCEKTFANRNNLNVHIRSHTGERPYGCAFCQKKFPSSNALKKHQRMHTGEKPYICPQCNKTFAAKETLNRHVKTHTGVKPHTCQFCGKAFIQLNQLRAHIFHHTGENAYECSYCGRAFNRKTRLTTHVKFVHEGAEPLACPYKPQGCPKTFFRNEDVLRHLAVHSTEKHFSCDKCEKSFSSHATLKAHQLTHRKEPPVTCHACGRAFIRQDCLVRHMRSKHRDVMEDILASAEKKKIKKRLSQMAAEDKQVFKNNRVWNEYALTESVKELLTVLVDLNNLKDLGYPETSVDKLLDGVIQRCGQTPAAVENMDYTERMRENVKILFTVVVDEATRDELLSNNSVEDVILHILKLAKQSDEIIKFENDIKLEDANENPDDPTCSEESEIKIVKNLKNPNKDTTEQTSTTSHTENVNEEGAIAEESNDCEDNVDYSFTEILEESNETSNNEENFETENICEESLEEIEVTADDKAEENEEYILHHHEIKENFEENEDYIVQNDEIEESFEEDQEYILSHNESEEIFEENEEYIVQHDEIEENLEEREQLEYKIECKTEEIETVYLEEDVDFFEEQHQERIIIEMTDD